MGLPELSGSPMVLDGGLTTELEARGHDLSDELRSARLLLDRWLGSSRFPPAQTRQWHADGIQILGGCCRVGPQ